MMDYLSYPLRKAFLVLTVFCSLSCEQDHDLLQGMEHQPEQPNFNEYLSSDSLYLSEQDALLLAQSLSGEFEQSGESVEEILRKKGGKLQKKVRGQKVYKDKKGKNAFYVFGYEKEQGFSIVSADKRLQPVLAYSDSGSISLDSSNPGLEKYLSNMNYYISELRYSPDAFSKGRSKAMNTKQQEGFREANPNVIADGWYGKQDANTRLGDCIYSGYIEIIGPLIGTRWSQLCPHNEFNPWKDNACRRAPAGCGPVAVSQLLYYYRKNLRPLSYNGQYIDFNKMSKSVVRNYDYDKETWYDMPAPDISRLSRLVGNKIVLDWGKDYTMSAPSRIPDFLKSLGFSTSYKSDWHHSTVKREIRAGRPVIVKAADPNSWEFFISFNQHIWLIEGYQYRPCSNTEYYRFNWGWRGRDNGWYTIYDWRPASSDLNEEYSRGRKMIIARL